jgi:hypothetical protein
MGIAAEIGRSSDLPLNPSYAESLYTLNTHQPRAVIIIAASMDWRWNGGRR